MAKKKKVEVEEPQIEETVVETAPVVEQPKEILKPKNEWEIKDRLYLLKGNKKPLSRSIKSANIYYFDKDKGFERELKFDTLEPTSTRIIASAISMSTFLAATNASTCFSKTSISSSAKNSGLYSS